MRGSGVFGCGLVLFKNCFKDNIEVTHTNIENHFKILKMGSMVLSP